MKEDNKLIPKLPLFVAFAALMLILLVLISRTFLSRTGTPTKLTAGLRNEIPSNYSECLETRGTRDLKYGCVWSYDRPAEINTYETSSETIINIDKKFKDCESNGGRIGFPPQSGHYATEKLEAFCSLFFFNSDFSFPANYGDCIKLDAASYMSGRDIGRACVLNIFDEGVFNDPLNKSAAKTIMDKCKLAGGVVKSSNDQFEYLEPTDRTEGKVYMKYRFKDHSECTLNIYENPVTPTK